LPLSYLPSTISVETPGKVPVALGPLEPDKLCREAAMSRSQLYRVVEREGGVANYIKRRRLSESFVLLSDVSRSVAVGKIAEALCFSDAASFSRAFRREFGISPSEVRAAAMAGLPVASCSSRASWPATRSFSDCLCAP
jgi:AraC-like DNA-binding protein